jgi:hypothetical protein
LVSQVDKHLFSTFGANARPYNAGLKILIYVLTSYYKALGADFSECTNTNAQFELNFGLDT